MTTIKSIIEKTEKILPFPCDGFPYSFTVYGDFEDNKHFYTFNYSNPLDCVRNRNAFVDKWENIHGGRILEN